MSSRRAAANPTGVARLDRGVAVVAAAAAVGAAGSAFAVGFTGGRLAGLVALGTSGGAAAGMVLTAAWKPALARVVVAGALLVAAVGAAIRSLSPAAVARAVTDGPRHLLTVGLPADADLPARSVPVVVCFVGAATAVALVRRGWAAGLPVVALVLAGVALATGAPTGPAQPGVALAVAGGVLLAVAAAGLARPGPSATRAGLPAGAVVRRRRPMGALAIMAVALVVGAGTGRTTAGEAPGDRASLRSSVAEPALPSEVRNPLDAVAVALGDPEDVVYGTVALDRPQSTRLPIATFDSYDGDTFLFGTVVAAPGAGSSETGIKVTSHLTLDTWPFAALPHAGPAVTVDAPPEVADRIGVDRDTGRIVVGEDGAGTWTITSSSGRTTVAPSVAIDVGHEVAPFTPLPAGQLDTIVEEATADRARLGDTVALAQTLAERFRTVYRAVPAGAPAAEQRGGHGALVLGCLVNPGFTARPPACAERVGTRTQLAAAFVLVLRQMGLPARLAVGWELAPATVAQPLRSHALTAWAEVPLPGGDWFAVDPVPERAGETGDLGRDASASRSGSSSASSTEDDRDRAGTPAPGPTRRRAPLAAVGGGLVALLLAGAPAIARRVRLRRRRRGSGAERLVGAWYEMRDQVRERGVAVPPGTLVTDVVRLHGITDPGVAAAVNAVAFGGAVGDDGDAARAWTALTASDRAWRRAAHPRDRARRYFRLGPVIGRR